jgi:glycosyltransferase involved in cell wall biosynthesis
MKGILNKSQKLKVVEYPNQVSPCPKVSISVITYQHSKYIEKCLDGLLNQQTDFEFEILLSEDDSLDDTRDKCIKYAEKYPRNIRLFLQNRENNIAINGSPTGRFSFMYNYSQSNGEFFAMCEGDDYWTDPLKLQKQVDFLKKNSDFVLCFHPCTFLIEKDQSEDQLVEQSLNSIDYEYSVYNLLSKWNIPTASLVFRKTINSFPEWFTEVASGDIALVMLLSEKGKFKLLKEWMSVYRISGKGVSQDHSGYRMIHFRAVLYSKLNEFFNYRHEKEIYDALDSIYNEFSDKPKSELKLSLGERILKRSKKYFK